MKTKIKQLKGYFPILLIVLAYIFLLIFNNSFGQLAVKNSQYYLKEMLMIMPCIFVITALLDVWIPKKVITRYLGKDAHLKGILLSFLFGGISAGPIYAAFPICVTLHKKGASVRNIVIILSSWAVIKLPMLLNEIKYLGLRFMVIRWILTVLAIILFSWITSKLVKDTDLPKPESALTVAVSINENSCIGCGRCTRIYPDYFTLVHKKAQVKSSSDPYDPDKLKEAVDACPVNAITAPE